MNPIRIATYGFPGAISELIARAAMTLPPLSGDDNAYFLRTVLAVVTSVFWLNYASDLPEDVQKSLGGIIKKQDPLELQKWVETYADIDNDQSAQQRANRVLADLEAKLPSLLKEEYTRFTTEVTTA